VDFSALGGTRGDDWWDRLDDLFGQARSLPEPQRARFLDRACGHDVELRSALDSLLQHAASSRDSASPLATIRHGSDLVGRTLQHYTIEAHLGGGGMGVVYRARDLRLQRRVALKFLLPELRAMPAAKTRFLVEARAAAAIDHPNICTIHEVGETDDGAPFIAMTYYEGETLKERLARGALAIGEALDYVLQTAEGLCAAHARGVVHRDVKPANIFITRDGVAKLIDFGVAKVDNLVLTKAGVAIGTAGYMSPEQIRSRPVDARTDVWALGVVLFEALARQAPFRGDYPGLILRATLLEEPPSLLVLRPETPPAVEAVIRQALAKSPHDRQPTVAQFLADLRAALPSDDRSPLRVRRWQGSGTEQPSPP